MLWGRMPRAVTSLAEEILSHISIKIKIKKALKETELQHTAAMTSLICLEYSAKTHLLAVASSTSDFTYTGKQLRQGH